jgi:hypothetical protein
MYYSLKEQAIRDYISKVNFKTDWNYAKIEEDMRRFLGERPFLDVKWKKDVMLNEVSGEAKEIKALEKISVIFTDLDEKQKKIEILID